jgi:hypothetical protein
MRFFFHISRNDEGAGAVSREDAKVPDALFWAAPEAASVFSIQRILKFSRVSIRESKPVFIKMFMSCKVITF